MKKIHDALESFAADGLGFDSASSLRFYLVFSGILLRLSAPTARTETNPGENEWVRETE